MDLGAEKLVARYVGALEQLAFNASVLRESLTSLEGSRFLAGGIERLDSLEWTTAPIAIGQKILAGELADVIAAIRAGVAYANVHTTLSPGGEIRGQIKASNDKD